MILFFGPVCGFGTSCVGRNFRFHLIVSMLAMVDFTILDREGIYSSGTAFSL